MYKYDGTEAPTEHIDGYGDTDVAGCTMTQQSISGGWGMEGGCVVKHCSKTQLTITLSSGEAQLTGICVGVAQAMSWKLKLRAQSDSTEAEEITTRRGLGMLHH